MSDADWGDIDQVPSKKRSPLLLFCGAGCVVLIVLMLAGGFWMYRTFERSLDPEVQWAELNELLPYDQRPTGWKMQGGFQLGMADFEFYVLTTASGEDVSSAVTILQIPKNVDEMFDPDRDSVEIWTPSGQEQPLTHIVVQGRTLRLAVVEGDGRTEIEFWGSRDSENGADGEADIHSEQPAVVVDLTPEGAEFPIVLYWSQEDLELLSPDQIRAFLAPFHIGPNR